MKKIISLFALFAMLVPVARSAGTPVIHLKNKPEARATFDKLWVDYDITDNGQKGMRIHIKFTTYEMKNMDAYVAIYFQDEDEVALKDKNQKFYSTAGDVALYQSIKPQYDPADYNDLQLFMPYSELDLDPGEYDLTMDVKVIYKEGGVISKLTKYDFEYSKPGTSTSKSASATFDKLWVDYNVTENGKKGMRIHVKFNVLNMKSTDCSLAIYFEKKNGDKVYTNNTSYRAKNGQVAVYKSLTPAYDNTVYNDLTLFLPYEVLNLGTGRWDLKMDADVIYKNGDLLKHLDYHEFWIE